jgi:hypothetical protein
MSRRVVMRLHEFSSNIEAAEKFLAAARAAGAGPKSKLIYAVTEEGEPCFYIELPEVGGEALKRARKPKPRVKVQRVVQKRPAPRTAVQAPQPSSKKVIVLKAKKKRPQ